MQLAALTAAKAKWGDKAVPMIKDRMLRMPFRRGEEKSDYEGYGPGIVFINATTKQRPGVVNGQVQKILDPGEVYAGCYVYAEINPFTYDTKGNKGVSFGLNNIQKCANGESIGGRAPAEQVFKPLADDEGTIDGSVDEVFA
jgi:hypothetical protein